MVKIYLKRIAEGTMALEDVPERWRPQVAAQLPPQDVPLEEPAEA